MCYHRCHYEKIYLSPEYLCDNIVHCLYSHDDESICDEVSNFGIVFLLNFQICEEISRNRPQVSENERC